MSGYWLAVVPAIGGAFALWCGIVLWAPWQPRPRHAAFVRDQMRPEKVEARGKAFLGSMNLDDEREFCEGPHMVVSRAEFGDLMARPPLEDWTGPLLDELRDGPTVFDDLSREDGTAMVAGESPARLSSGDETAVPLGPGEAEPFGVTAPPAPDYGFPGTDGPLPVVAGDSGRGSAGRSSIPAREPSRLLRTTGEIMRADMVADCCAFMGRQDAEVAVWVAARMAGEWAVA